MEEKFAVDLDDKESFSRIDVSKMLEVVLRFPEQLRDAMRIAQADVILPEPSSIRNIVVFGMGGSGISGDIAQAMASGVSPVPVICLKGYTVPNFVGDGTLAFSVSYSGNTEETLEATRVALERGARVIGITSGGALGELLREKGVFFFEIPSGFQPRAAVGYLCVPLLLSLERCKVMPGIGAELEKAVELAEHRAEEYGPDNPTEANPTKRLAKGLFGYLPVIYGSEGFIWVAAMRWKTQINENAKYPAFFNSFPELNHNETVGWKNLGEICRLAHIIVLREDGEHQRTKLRVEITTEILGRSVARITQVCARGTTRTEKIFDLLYFSDFLSVYLSLLLGEDPTPVERIAELKRRLEAYGG